MQSIGSDPPNSWSDSPAPTFADLTITQRTDNIHQNGHHYFICIWQNSGGDWRSWLLKTEDDGASWVWRQIQKPEIADDGYIYPVSISYAVGVTPGTEQNIIGEPNGQYVNFCGNPNPPCGSWLGELCVEYGVVLNVGTLVTIKVWSALTDGAQSMSRCRWGPGGTGIDSFLWYHNGVDPFGTRYTKVGTKSYGSGSHTEAHVHFGDQGGFPDPGDTWGGFDTIGVLASSINASPPGTKSLWMDVDSEDGTILWMTVWTDEDTLVLQKRNTSDLALVTEYALGDCTEAQLNAGTYYAAPHCPEFSNQRCYVFGRMQAPQGLADPSHLIQTTDAGTSFSAIETGLGTSVITNLRANGTNDGTRTLFAIVSAAAASPYLYSGVESLAQISQLTDLPSGLVNVDAAAWRTDADTGVVSIAVGSPSAQAIMVVRSDDGGLNFSDITGNYPQTGAVTSLVFV
ncbi:MAG: hypothetical protein ACYTEQ_25800 [Planctomycetota bacterium]